MTSLQNWKNIDSIHRNKMMMEKERQNLTYACFVICFQLVKIGHETIKFMSCETSVTLPDGFWLVVRRNLTSLKLLS